MRIWGILSALTIIVLLFISRTSFEVEPVVVPVAPDLDEPLMVPSGGGEGPVGNLSFEDMDLSYTFRRGTLVIELEVNSMFIMNSTVPDPSFLAVKGNMSLRDRLNGVNSLDNFSFIIMIGTAPNGSFISATTMLFRNNTIFNFDHRSMIVSGEDDNGGVNITSLPFWNSTFNGTPIPWGVGPEWTDTSETGEEHDIPDRYPNAIDDLTSALTSFESGLLASVTLSAGPGGLSEDDQIIGGDAGSLEATDEPIPTTVLVIYLLANLILFGLIIVLLDKNLKIRIGRRSRDRN